MIATTRLIKCLAFFSSLNSNLNSTGSRYRKLETLRRICDSYVGANHDLSLDPIDVAEGENSDRPPDDEMEK